MHKSKLIRLLKTFSNKELKQFSAFVASPFYNTNEELTGFIQHLMQFAPEFTEHALEKEVAYHALFPFETFDKKRLDYLMNGLLKLAEQYLAIQEFQNDCFPFQAYTLQAFVDRKLEKHYQYLYRKLDHSINEASIYDTQIYYNRYRLANIASAHFISQKIRRNDENLQLASDALDQFYFLQKLKFSCEMLNRQAILSASYEIQFAEEVATFLGNQQRLPPLIEIFLEIFGYLKSESDEHLHRLLALIQQHSPGIAQVELREIYLYAINFCVRRIRKGELDKIDTALSLYEAGIQSKAIFENEYVSHWTYSNVVKLALMREKYNWIESFIHKYNENLAPQFRDDALYYNLAELYYHKKEFGSVLDNLNRLHFTDLHYHLGSRVLLLKTYYELGEMEPLTALLASFSVYLRRNKKVSLNMKKTCLNFCNLLHKILRLPAEDPAVLRQQIQTTQPLAERTWLLRVLN